MSCAVNILGTRGIPAQHGGFETFAERLALHLAGQGRPVTVYCQDDLGSFADGAQDVWRGVTRIHFRPSGKGPLGTLGFDLKAVRHVLSRPGVDLVLGYNSALFSLLQRLRGRRVVMNMDGIEWKRSKWSAPAKLWFYVNEGAGLRLSQSPIADHPEIARHLKSRARCDPIVIPYGADAIGDADPAHLGRYGLTPDRYVISVARIEPENSIRELVTAARALPDGFRAVFLGRLDPANPYHRAVRDAADDRAVFPGAVYDPPTVQALRFFARAYLHGHQVGGTNPSLVEALGAGNAVIAHDNPFNRWTAGPEQAYFTTAEQAAAQIGALCRDDARAREASKAARLRHARAFDWDAILAAYVAVIDGAPLPASLRDVWSA